MMEQDWLRIWKNSETLVKLGSRPTVVGVVARLLLVGVLPGIWLGRRIRRSGAIGAFPSMGGLPEDGSVELFRTIFDHGPQGIAVIGLDLQLERVNRRLAEILGFPAEELAELSLPEITYGADLDAERVLPEELIRGDISRHQVEKRYLTSDNRPVWFRVTVSVVRDEDQLPLYAVAVFEEIEERKAAEARMQQNMAELKRANEELQQFAYIASHDLQEPLRMVTGYLQLLQHRYAGRLDEDADQFIGYAVDGAARMKTLIRDLLAYSRVATRAKPPTPTDMGAVLEEVLAGLQLAIARSGATITHDPLPTVITDETQLAQLLQNLIENALKFQGEAPPQVHIGVQKVEDGWQFAISDNGIGFKQEYAERIFVLFQRLHTREEYAGTGIGLAICQKIVERHGGRIWAESEPGAGTTFYFTLPANRDPNLT